MSREELSLSNVVVAVVVVDVGVVVGSVVVVDVGVVVDVVVVDVAGKASALTADV